MQTFHQENDKQPEDQHESNEGRAMQPKLIRKVSPKLKRGLSKKGVSQKVNSKLPSEVSEKMESSFGQDFSDVSIHENSSKATELGAKAYTQGSDIHFAPGKFNPHQQEGQELIGHELAHVVQQREGKIKGDDINGKDYVHNDAGLEKDADQMGKKAASGIPQSYGLKVANTALSNNSPILKKDDEVFSATDAERATRIYRAITGLGTDEEVIFAVLNELKNQSGSIEGLKRAYLNKYGEYLTTALRGDLDDEDYAKAIGCLKPTIAATKENAPGTNVKAPVVVDAPLEPGNRKIKEDKVLVNFRSTPDTKSVSNILFKLKFNDDVTSISAHPGGWAKVKVGSTEGYVIRTALSSIVPGKEARLYRIQSGDSLERMFYQMGFGTKVPEKGLLEKLSFQYSDADVLNDPRFFANAVYFLNNATPKKDPAVYMEGGGKLNMFQMATQTDYQRLKVKEGYMMWLPSKEYIAGLIGVIKPGSVKGNAEFSVAQQVDKYWTDGFGVKLEVGVGATFGIPVGADASQTFYAVRQGNKIIIRAQYTLAGGLDTGISAGVFVGSGKKDKKGNRIGIGAQAGANADAKAKLLMFDEYAFEYKKPGAMASALFIAISRGMIGPKGMIGTAMQQIGSYMTNPDKYLTKRKTEFGLVAGASANAEMGVKKGKLDDDKNIATYKDKESANKYVAEKIPVLSSLLGIGISIDASLEALGGIETNFDDTEVTNKYYFHFAMGVNASLPGPLAPLASIFPGNGGVELIIQTKHQKGRESEPSISNSIIVKIIRGDADMDFIGGNGTEISLPPITGGLTGLANLPQKLKDTYVKAKQDPFSLLGLLNDMEIEKVVEFPVHLGKFEERLQKQKTVKRMLKDSMSARDILKNGGVGLSGIFHIKFKIRKLEEKKDVLINALKSLSHYKLSDIYDMVTEFYKTGKVHPDLQQFFDVLMDVTQIDLLEVIVMGTAGVGAGASVADGLKLRLEGFAQGSIFHRYLLKLEDKKPDLTVLRELITII